MTKRRKPKPPLLPQNSNITSPVSVSQQQQHPAFSKSHLRYHQRHLPTLTTLQSSPLWPFLLIAIQILTNFGSSYNNATTILQMQQHSSAFSSSSTKPSSLSRQPIYIFVRRKLHLHSICPVRRNRIWYLIWEQTRNLEQIQFGTVSFGLDLLKINRPIKV